MSLDICLSWTCLLSLLVSAPLLGRHLPCLIRTLVNEVWALSPGECHGLFGTSNGTTFISTTTKADDRSRHPVLCVASTVIAEGLMFMRAYALSKQSKAVRWYLMAHYAASHVLPCAFLAHLTRGLPSTRLRNPRVLPWSFTTSSPSLVCLIFYLVWTKLRTDYPAITVIPPFPMSGQPRCIPYTSKQAHLSAIFALVFFNQLSAFKASFPLCRLL